jgi:hypothetical protein
MSTSIVPTQPSTRSFLRLRLATHPGLDRLDGGWWPQSRDLSVELADLVDHFPTASGRIQRAVVSPPDWDPSPRRIPVARGFVKVGSFPRDDTHVILLKMSDFRILRILVVPPGLTDSEAEEALLAASTSGNAHSAGSLLETVTDHTDGTADDHWTS